jgi:hypothetical protein
MSLPIVFMTVVVRIIDLERRWPGGVATFKVQYPHCAEDGQIISLASMSSEEAQEDIDRLIRSGFLPGEIAVLEIFHGWFEQVNWLEIGMDAGRPICWLTGYKPLNVEPWRSPLST